MPGRKRDEAPNGYSTVREAAARLGISDTAVRQRIQRGTLDVMDNVVTEGGGEPRYYIPEHALARALEEKNLPVTRRDTAEVMLNSESLAREVAETIRLQGENAAERLDSLHAELERNRLIVGEQFAQVLKNQERLIGELGEAVDVMRETAETEKAYQAENIDIMREQAKKREGGVSRGMVAVVAAAVLCLLAVAIVRLVLEVTVLGLS